jgi:hypothetical protein
MKLPRSISSLTLALGLACAFPAVAQAAVVYDEIIVQDLSGTVFASVTATPDEIAADPYAVFYVSGVAVDVTQDGNYSDIVDGDGNAIELFGVANGGPDGYDLGFAYQAIAAGYPVQNAVMPTGAPIDMTMYLDPALQLAGYTASLIVSGANSGVPEPLTWAMMVVGFAAIGCGLRRGAYVRRTALA